MPDDDVVTKIRRLCESQMESIDREDEDVYDDAILPHIEFATDLLGLLADHVGDGVAVKDIWFRDIVNQLQD